MSLSRLDKDLAEQVSDATRHPFRAAAIGFLGVAVIVAIDLLYGSRLPPVAYAAIALAVGVVDATVLGGALRLRMTRLRWARNEQRRLDQEQRVIQATRSSTASRRALEIADIIDVEEGTDDDDR
jgi:hypothetical protein